MLKKVKEDIKKWKHILCSWIGKLNIIKISIITKEIYRLNAIPIKIAVFLSFFLFAEIGKKNCSKIHMVSQGTLSSQNNRQKAKLEDSHFQILRLNWKAIIIIIEEYWHKDRYTDQWNRIESLGINPCLYGQMTFDKNVQTIQWVKDSLPHLPPQ